MEGGPPAFPADSTCPQVLRIPVSLFPFPLRDSHTLWSIFPDRSGKVCSIIPVHTPKAFPSPVWPLPLSLAATDGISFDFFSSAYSDVSLRRVPLLYLWIQYRIHGSSPWGFPHSDIRGSRLICSSPRLFAACHVLLRLLMPRHSPCALFRLNFYIDTILLISHF